MKRIRIPNFTVAEALGCCIESIRDENLVARLSAQSMILNAAEDDYRLKGGASQLYMIQETDSVGAHVTLEEMKSIYSNTFARKGSPARHIYDDIRASAPGGICPLCAQRVVSTLDHHLAKSKHAVFSITPLNLIPACKDCNTDSQVRRPKHAGEQTLHPYFDFVDEEQWLVCQVFAETPPVAQFIVAPPATWSDDKKSIVKRHFQVFKLGELYSTHAAVELINVYQDLVESSELQSPQEISLHLRSIATRRRRPLFNSWQAAMYQALADSEWFCNGGYLEISKSSLLQGFN
jgi:5-methylcytosine-specific restriction endonuclease McrA